MSIDHIEISEQVVTLGMVQTTKPTTPHTTEIEYSRQRKGIELTYEEDPTKRNGSNQAAIMECLYP